MWKPVPPPHWRFKKKEYAKGAATASFIYRVGDSPILRQPSMPVPIKEIGSVDFQRKLAYLKSCLRRFRKLTGIGVGIAAVQVGIPERFAIIWIPKIQEEMLVIINPTVLKRSKEKYLYPEMCMSADLAIASVVRPAWVAFEYFDEHGIKQRWERKAEDIAGLKLNRVAMHELDHLDGTVNIDLVPSKDIIFHSDPAFYKKKTLFVKI